MINWSKNIRSLAPFWVYYCLLIWFIHDHIFFWDTVQLASKHAHWYYEQNFQYFLLPENINSGHPPIFGMYIAGCWKVFGKTLMVSHFSMLPFLLGIVWLLHKIGTYYGNAKTAKYLMLLVLVDPFFAGQSVLVSPDIVLVFAFLLCVHSITMYSKESPSRTFPDSYRDGSTQLKPTSILNPPTIGIVLGVILLGTISLRGMMVTFGLYLWWIITNYFQIQTNRSSLKNLLSIAFQKLPYFLPAGILAILFLGYHYQKMGWIGYHPNSPWAGSFKQVGLVGFLKNIGLLGWRMLDFGRLFLWGGLIWVLFKKVKINRFISSEKDMLKAKSLLILILVLSLLLTPSLLLHEGLMSHRYLLPITLSITLLFYHLSVLLTGNFWVYPKHIAQGWDATLAHIPYYKLRNKMMQYIEQEGIPLTEIGTVFPNIGPLEIYDLKGQSTGLDKKDFNKNKYFFYSVVYNDVSDEELQELENEWTVLKEFKAYGIAVILYKKG